MEQQGPWFSLREDPQQIQGAQPEFGTSPVSTPSFFLDPPITHEDINNEDMGYRSASYGGFDPQPLFSRMDLNPVDTGNPPSPQNSMYNFGYPPASPQQNAEAFLHDVPLLTTNVNQFGSYGLSTPNTSVSTPTTPQSSFARISVQPERFQVVNYNIHPAVEIEFGQHFNEPITVQAFLVYDNSVEIREGFTNGDVQVLKVGLTKVSFPALHLNRMTPIKNAVQQSGSLNSLVSTSKDVYPYSIKFKIGDFIIHSGGFKLVSAVNQIPSGIDVRPRKSKHTNPRDEVTSPAQPLTTPAPAKPAPSSSKVSSTKRRATNDLGPDEEIYLHVKVRGDSAHRGFINIPKDASLKQAREEINRSPNYPKNFRFWFEKMATIVQPHQEEIIKAAEAVDGTTLILEPFDPIMQEIDEEVLSPWLSKKEEKEPVVTILEVIRKLFNIYGKEFMKEYQENNSELSDLTIINGGISHFLANITKNKEKRGMVGIEDFKLFLKFFGPPRDCLHKVLNVYREGCFHGFARHADAVEALKGKSGHFLIRYSESQLKDGFFAFNVNRGTTGKDIIENYSLKYHSDIECFVFRNKRYKTLREFITDPDYGHILKYPLSKTTVETVKESNYKNDTDFLRNSALQ